MLSPLTVWALYFIIGVARAALPACSNTTNADYDFVVVGAGAGGGPLAARLAEAGYSVLLVDAGHNTTNDLNTTIPLYTARALQDPQIFLNYSYQEYSTGSSVDTANDKWYPRASGLGGSTIHNNMVNIIAGTEQVFNWLETTFNDPTWSRDNMQNYFTLIENNLYLLPPNPDHGFSGWLKTSSLPMDIFAANHSFFDAQIGAFVAQRDPLVVGPPIPDLNSRLGDSAVGASGMIFSIDENHVRSSVRERLAAVQQSNPGLHILPDTLATKILLCNSSSTVTAYGVQVVKGAALPVAGNFKGKDQNLNSNVMNVTARHEVIVSAGVFQSPQLLMLSGIGDRVQLSQFGIEPIVHLPGVGNNLQDHDEVPVNWHMKNNFTMFDGCKWLSDPAQDPCLEYWLTHNHQNAYALAGPMYAVITQSSPSLPVLDIMTPSSPSLSAPDIMTPSSPSLPAPDIMTYWSPVEFHGFVRGQTGRTANGTHNGLTAVVLKSHPSSRGTVKLTGSHPQDPLYIQKLHFQASNGPVDVAAIREGIKRAMKLANSPPLSHFVRELAHESNLTTDAGIEQYIHDHVFGHHACCTNAIGPDNDPNAVLDGNFKVKGVNNLRVVDTSAWPLVPGFFVTTPTYMMSEKAAEVIKAAAAQKAAEVIKDAAAQKATEVIKDAAAQKATEVIKAAAARTA